MSKAAAHSNPLVRLLCDYVDIDSVTGREAEFLERLEADFNVRGYRCQRQAVTDERWNLIALPSGPVELIYSTHIDVVPPFMPSRLEHDRVCGRGACDTKGGLVAMMAAADRIDPSRQRVGFVLVVGEEVDHIGAIHAGNLDLRPKAVILCEPTEGKVVAGQKGMLKVGLYSDGLAAHSAFPELGRDALGPLLDTLQAIRVADYPADPVLGPTTVNIGLVHAGVAANVTPPHARAELAFRVACDPDALFEQVSSLCAPGVRAESLSQNGPIVLNAVEGFESINIAFNTDAEYMSALAPVYLTGPGDIRCAHSVDEHITIADLLNGVEDYVRLGELLLSQS